MVLPRGTKSSRSELPLSGYLSVVNHVGVRFKTKRRDGCIGGASGDKDQGDGGLEGLSGWANLALLCL